MILAVALGLALAGDIVLARFDAGEVSESDVLREERYLSGDERHFRDATGQPAAQSWLDWIRRGALRRIGERAAGAGTALERETARRQARDWWIRHWRESCYGLPLALPSDAALRAELPELRYPARIRLSHIFLRAKSDDERRSALAQLAAWRGQIASLEQFQEYARRHSQSETRHKHGRLGFLPQGFLPAAAEATLYALPVATMSGPMELRGGVHLFWIERVEPARIAPLEPRLQALRASKAGEAREACRSQRLRQTSIASESRGTSDWPDLTVGAWSLSGADMRTLYAPSGRPPAQVRQAWIEDEKLYQSALAAGAVSADERQHLRDLEADVTLRRLLEARVAARLPRPTPAELRERHDAAPERYRSPKRMAAQVLEIERPQEEDPLMFWDRLEAAADALRAGDTTWEAARTQLGPKAAVQDIQLAEVLHVAGGVGPLVFERIKDGGPGEVFGPIQDGARFVIVRLGEIQPPRPLSLAEAEARLRAELEREARPALTEAVAAELLAGAHFELTEAGRARLAALAGEEHAPAR